MRGLIFVFIFCVTPLLTWSQSHEVSFTFDDLPLATYSENSIEFQRRITEKLLSKIKKNQIPAIGFVNEVKLYANDTLDKKKVYLLKQWLESGLDLGNHTFSHINYHNVPFEVYTRDIIRGSIISKALATEYNKSYKYFRHPFLRIGKTKAAHDSLNHFLNAHGYTEAPVSIDNTDYLFASAYDKASVKGDTLIMDKIGKLYITYMEAKLKFYQESSQALFGRNIKHILVLHANPLNADFLDALADMYRKNNYKFVSLDAALNDPVYATEISKYGNWGISWIDRWALSKGKSGDFFKGDPDTPEFIKDFTKKASANN